jgi:hypothetical protein
MGGLLCSHYAQPRTKFPTVPADLVDKDQVLGRDLPDLLAKDRPLLLDVGTILLAGA